MKKAVFISLGTASAIVWLLFCLITVGVLVVYCGGDVAASPTSTDRE